MPTYHRPRTLALTLSLALLSLATIGCGGEDAVAETAASTAAEASELAPAAAPTVQAAKAAGTVDTQYFTTVLPEGWEVLADDIDSMGLMTLAENGTGGAHGVYMKFEKGYQGDPMANVDKMASNYDGTPATSSRRNGIDWASTRYTYSGITQTLNITAHDGSKVTFTVMGADYTTDPGVRAIFDALELK